MAEQFCYIVNLSHHKRDDRYITFWRPDNKCYAWPLSWAGRYPVADVMRSLDYHHNGSCNIAVHCEAVDALVVDPVPGTVDNDAGPVVLNTQANWQAILQALIAQPVSCAPEPEYPGYRPGKKVHFDWMNAFWSCSQAEWARICALVENQQPFDLRNCLELKSRPKGDVYRLNDGDAYKRRYV